MPKYSSTRYLSVTVEESGEGAHARRKLLLAGLSSRGEKIVWTGPSFDDIRDLGDIEFHNLGPPSFLKKVPMVGTTLMLLMGILTNRKYYRDSDTFLAFGELELLAVKLFLPRMRVVFIQRNDIVEKSRILSRISDNFSRKLRLTIRSKSVAALQHFVLPNVDHIIVQTPAHSNKLVSRFTKLPVITVVPNDAPISRCKLPAKQTPTAKKLPTIGFLGRVEWEAKGLGLLLESFHLALKRQDMLLSIAGDGKDIAKLEAVIEQLGIENSVKLVGKVSDPYLFLGDLDILLATSPYDDCPNVVLEAMVANIPIVATDIDAHEFLLSGSPGLYSPTAAHKISDGIIKCLTDPDNRSAILNAQRRQLDKFDFDWVGKMSETIKATDFQATD